MSNDIRLRAISDLLDGESFFIPSYQRGYRWEKGQIYDLLDDIWGFAQNPNNDPTEFYCLQPIVVQKRSGPNAASYEVIDGQQRLTTIHILINYIVRALYPTSNLSEQHDGKTLYELHYESRPESNTFLLGRTRDDSDIDSYHFSNARDFIGQWFVDCKQPLRTLLEKMRDTLISDSQGSRLIKVIWYEINSKLEPNQLIEIFIRINLGKIPLTSSELIKALFLQDRPFTNEINETQNQRAKQLQNKIAEQWYAMEIQLRDDTFWWFLNRTQKNINNRIDLIFNLITDLTITDNSDPYTPFRLFYQKLNGQLQFEKLEKEWDDVRVCFNQLREWYLNTEWYHYIGFLILCGTNITSIYKALIELQKSQMDDLVKDDFSALIKEMIRKRFLNVEWTIPEKGRPSLNLSYSNERHLVREVLLLYNLEFIVRQTKGNNLILKFPFQTFKDFGKKTFQPAAWDVEHVDSFQENPLEERTAQVEWLEFALEELQHMPNTGELMSRITNFTRTPNNHDQFDTIHRAVVETVGESEDDASLKDNIGNLVLLDAGTNRSYKNALFFTKRRRILEKDQKVEFVPLCTRNVFLKSFHLTAQTNWRWSTEDIKAYHDDIADTLRDFLPQPPVANYPI